MKSSEATAAEMSTIPSANESCETKCRCLGVRDTYVNEISHAYRRAGTPKVAFMSHAKDSLLRGILLFISSFAPS